MKFDKRSAQVRANRLRTISVSAFAIYRSTVRIRWAIMGLVEKSGSVEKGLRAVCGGRLLRLIFLRSLCALSGSVRQT